jgi:RimJ/RimL family protein N-acetyltransferase
MAAQSVIETTIDTSAASAGDAAAVRFTERPLLQETRRSLDALASPLMAHAWVEAIMRFWQAGIAAGSIDPAEPLYLFDPASCEGQFAWLVLRALQQQLATNASGLKPCYVACGTHREELDSMATHPYLTEYAEHGWFDTALFPAGAGTAITLRQQGLSLLRTANPVVVLSVQWFGTLPSELYGLHQGRVMEGWVVTTEMASCHLDYEWRPLDESDLARSPHRRLLAHCLTRFTDTPLLIPAAANEAMEIFAKLSSHRYLLLSVDHGCHSEQQIRLGMLSPPRAMRRGSVSAPVNYHALSLHQEWLGARTWNCQLRDTGMVLHATWNNGHTSPEDGAFSSIVAPLAETHPDDSLQLAAMATGDHAPDAAGLLTLLRLSGYDPRALRSAMPAILEQTSTMCGTARHEWQIALSRIWSNYLPPASGDGFPFDAAVLAAEIGHWELAKACIQTGLAMYGDDVTALHHLAYCEAATGDTPLAMRLLDHALEHDPADPLCLALRERLAERLLHWENIGWYYPDAASRDELVLEPLGPEHAASVLYQYRDVQIGVMTRLPELNTLQEIRDWIEEQRQDASLASYAVMHRRWGFVGMVCNHRAGDAGYFYFWIGTDFQDRGWGQQAARLLFAQATLAGVIDLFTSVCVDNIRSRNALARLGFNEMTLHAHAPDDDLIFLHCRPQATAQPAYEYLVARISRLCEAIRSPIVFSNAIK